MTRPPLFGKVAVVTGASRGIGLAVAEELQAAGAHVFRLARSLRDGEAERRTDVRCDVTRPEDVRRAVRKVLRSHGAPDLLVNNAGSFMIKALADTTAEEFDAQMRSNVYGAFNVLRLLYDPMVARGEGLVVTVGSVADRRAFPGNAAYAAAKHALRGLHAVLAEELAGTGVRAALVSPGPVDTELWDPVDPDSRPGFTKRRNMLRAEDVAEAVLFVATRPERVAVTELRLMPRA